MNDEQREIWYDHDLQLEAYQLHGIVQEFPNHFHPYYVIGFIEGGKRHLWCKQEEYICEKGDLILFNPHDNHHCAPMDDSVLDYRAINVTTETMQRIMNDLFHTSALPHYTQPLIKHSDLTLSLSQLYRSIVENACIMEKEETLYFLMQPLLEEYAGKDEPIRAIAEPIQMLCDYMRLHFAENITLDMLCELSHFSKSYLLNAFTRQTGVSCYRYLQTIRIHEAKVMLEKGVSPVDSAAACGFSGCLWIQRLPVDSAIKVISQISSSCSSA